MALVPTNFSVAKTRRCPISNPEPPFDKPVAKTPELNVGVDSPIVKTPQDDAQAPAPNVKASESAEVVGNPSLKAAEDAVGAPVPVGKTAIAQPSAPAPVTITPNPVDATAPPFPLEHARIHYDNVLFNYSSVLISDGTNGESAIVPNTFQRWEFASAVNQEIEITLPANQDIDTICIGPHNLKGATINAFYRATPAGALVAFGDTIVPTNNNAIMIHLTNSVSAASVSVQIDNGDETNLFIGYISAGIALQMQRPFFSGHNPITDAQVVEFYTNRTETYNVIGREVRRRGQQTTASWNNIDDGWYRTYLEPIKDNLNAMPFFFAWNLAQYPLDVGFCELEADIQAPYSGVRSLRSVEMSLRGTL